MGGMVRKQGLPPIADEATRLFILGSLPGNRSLETGRYYAHPTNQFWKLVGPIVGEDLSAMDYSSRLNALARHGIGLWDVVSAAVRDGSADSAILDAVPNPIGGLKREYPRLEAIAFNGGRAAKDGRQLLAGVDSVTLYDLPSSSGRAPIGLSQKAAVWMKVACHVK